MRVGKSAIASCGFTALVSFPKSESVSLAIDKKACRVELEVKLGRKPTKEELAVAWEGYREKSGRNPNSRENCDKTNTLYESGTVGKTAYVTAPATDAARQWAGWGTALKPAWEPIIMARKPLEGTVAANVQKWGTGAINILACRVPSCKDAYSNDGKAPLRKDAHEKNRQSNRSQVLFEGQPDFDTPHFSNEYERENERQRSQCSRVDYPPSDRSDDGPVRLDKEGGQASSRQQGDAGELPDHLTKPRDNRECLSTYLDYTTLNVKSQGRWPANLIHDGSEEVLEPFPETKSGGSNGTRKNGPYSDERTWSVSKTPGASVSGGLLPDSGSAARFFYCAKSSRAERERGCGGMEERDKRWGGSIQDDRPHTKEGYEYKAKARNHHPTVKPLALMRYLCRLVTPPNGIILDPFMGSGTTGMAAKIEGFGFIGIEKEQEYIEIAERRIEATEWRAR